MKQKTAWILTLLLMMGLLTGCSSKMAELAFITDGTRVDDGSLCESAWNGMVQYAQEKAISKQYYYASAPTTQECIASIEKAIDNGAMVVVCMGESFEVAVHTAQKDYPEVAFILLDGAPHSEDDMDTTIMFNTVSVTFSEEQAGYLAGYAAVKEGFQELGYFGGEPSAQNIRYGFGFVQGAERAAQEKGMEAGSVHIKYIYTGADESTPATQAMAQSWYQAGTQCVFVANSALEKSVLASAGANAVSVIGAGTDRSAQSDQVIFSAQINIGQACYNMIKDFYDETFSGGQTVVYNAQNGGVLLSMAKAKVTVFTQKNYNEILAALAANQDGITDAILKTTTNPHVADAYLPLSIVTVEEFTIVE